ncbi:hypothetical protein BpHYR1_020569 [Brachionus plicatilis]|uniref:Uncharacterized protein n=1 Tax=Brachionus plicatilis TaxID=10195 RepID=A0A3M7QI60_BRAPC|nr:hypothetical protein BpHYR1_020569 [Brachionus plicatilis]
MNRQRKYYKITIGLTAIAAKLSLNVLIIPLNFQMIKKGISSQWHLNFLFVFINFNSDKYGDIIPLNVQIVHLKNTFKVIICCNSMQ